jgi:hypothetical protein
MLIDTSTEVATLWAFIKILVLIELLNYENYVSPLLTVFNESVKDLMQYIYF